MFAAPATAVPMPPAAVAAPVVSIPGMPSSQQQIIAPKPPENAHRAEDKNTARERRRRQRFQQALEDADREDEEEPSFRFFLPISTPFLAQFLAQVVIPARRRLTLVKRVASLYRKAYGLSRPPDEPDEAELEEVEEEQRDPIITVLRRKWRRREKEALPPPFVAPPRTISLDSLDAPQVISS